MAEFATESGADMAALSGGTVNTRGVAAHHGANGAGVLGGNGITCQFEPASIIAGKCQNRPIAAPQQTLRPEQIKQDADSAGDVFPAAAGPELGQKAAHLAGDIGQPGERSHGGCPSGHGIRLAQMRLGGMVQHDRELRVPFRQLDNRRDLV